MECLVSQAQRLDVDGNKTVAPHLLEEIYNLEDALLVGAWSTR